MLYAYNEKIGEVVVHCLPVIQDPLPIKALAGGNNE